MNHDLLKPLRGEIQRRKIATVDIEARQWVHPYAAGFYDGDKYWDRTGDDCVRDLLFDVILQPKNAGSWIYAHNGGNYDFLFLVRLLVDAERKYRTEVTPVGSCIFKVDVYEIDQDAEPDPETGKKPDKRTSKNWKQRWTFVDSARLMPAKLDNLCESFGIPGKVEIGMSYDELAKPENRDLARRYLKGDCTKLHACVSKMQDTINALGGQIGPTLPSTSLDLFRRKFQRKKIYTGRHLSGCPDYGKKPVKPKPGKKPTGCPGCGYAFTRSAYFGGRSEIFRMGFEPSPGHEEAELYDVNSMYPAAMLSGMPIGPGIKTYGLSEQDVYDNHQRMTGIVEATVEIPEDCYVPPLPVRHEGKLVFPVGRFSGCWDASELELLPQVGGRIIETRQSVWYEEYPIFTSFVEKIYKFRDKKSPQWTAAMDFIAKIILNAAYGKFAMRELRQMFVIHPADVEGMTPVDFESDIWSREEIVSPNYIVPQIAVHITALARRQLWEILNGVVRRGGRIYYCDTDSVVCSGVKLKTGGKLGQLKLEEQITRAQFVLPKLYLLETVGENKRKKEEANIKVKAKGMGPGIRVGELTEDVLDGQLSEAEFVDAVKNGCKIERHRISKFKESLREYSKGALTFPVIKPADKQIRSAYTKRQVLDGGDTRPIVFT